MLEADLPTHKHISTIALATGMLGCLTSLAGCAGHSPSINLDAISVYYACMQEPVLFARSVRRNILYGMEAEDGVPPEQVPSNADVERAASLANAHDFIAAMPQGYETVCAGGLPTSSRPPALFYGTQSRLLTRRASLSKFGGMHGCTQRCTDVLIPPCKPGGSF